MDNEFSGVLQSDSCRLMQLRCHTSRQGHLCRKFAWGNRKSLMEDPGVAGIDMREELLTHYRCEPGPGGGEGLCVCALCHEPGRTQPAASMEDRTSVGGVPGEWWRTAYVYCVRDGRRQGSPTPPC